MKNNKKHEISVVCIIMLMVICVVTCGGCRKYDVDANVTTDNSVTETGSTTLPPEESSVAVEPDTNLTEPVETTSASDEANELDETETEPGVTEATGSVTTPTEEETEQTEAPQEPDETETIPTGDSETPVLDGNFDE